MSIPWIDLQKNIYTEFGLIIGIICFFLLNLKILSYFDISNITGIFSVIIRIIGPLLFFSIWIYLQSYFPKNKYPIGIILAIESEKDEQKIRIRNDLKKNLDNYFLNNGKSNIFNVIVLNEYQTSKLIKIIRLYISKKNNFLKNCKFNLFDKTREYKNWKKIDKKVNGNVYIFGSIKERREKEDKYIIQVGVLANHAPININALAKISKNLCLIFPRSYLFDKTFELSGFYLTSNYFLLAVKYIVGIAYFSYEKFEEAFNLHCQLKEEINNYIPHPLKENLLNYLILLLSTELFNIGFNCFKNGDFNKAYDFFKKSNAYKPNYNSYIFLSYIEFNVFNDSSKSLKTLSKAKKLSNGSLLYVYNKAFILMNSGKYEKALKLYNSLINAQSFDEDDIVLQCVEYNENFYKKNNTCHYCLFILGFLYFEKQKNYPLALEKFESFFNVINGDVSYHPLVNKAEKYIYECNHEMGLL